MTFISQRSRTPWVGAMLTTLALLFAVGCASTSDEEQRLRVALHFNSPQTSWVGIYVAQEKGYYEEAGLDLEFQYLGGSTLAVQAVGAGRADLGIASPDALISGVNEELPVVAVANHLQQDATGVIVDGEAADFADLADKRVATAQGTAEAGLFQAALTRAGVAEEVDTDYVESASKCTMVISGQADACTGFAFAQLIQVQLEGVDATFLPFSTESTPLPGAAILTTEDRAEGDDAVERFLEATFRGYADADEDREMAVDVMKDVSDTGDPQQIEESTELVLDLMRSDATDSHGWGWSNEQTWGNLVEQMVEGEVLGESLEPAELFTNDLLPENAGEWQ